MSKEDIINEIIAVEGGYVYNPSDSGGPTRFGITESVARLNGYDGDMRELPREFAFAVYEDRYWNGLLLDKVAARSMSIAEELCDTAVNMGVSRAGRFLQRSLNVLNMKEASYPDVVVDGSIGQKTIQVFNSYMDLRRSNHGSEVLLKMLNSLQGAFYVELAERREKDEAFIYGWFKNRVAI